MSKVVALMYMSLDGYVADALLFGRVTYEMMEATWRPVAPTLLAGLSKYIDLNLVSRLEFGSGRVALRYEPIRNQSR